MRHRTSRLTAPAWIAGLLLAAGSVAAQTLPPPPPTTPAGEPVVLELAGGTRLRGIIVSESDDVIVLRADDLGETAIPAGSIAQRLPGDARLGPKPTDEKLPPPGLFGTGILEGFDKSVSAGISGREADTSEITFNVAADAFYNGDDRRWRFSSAYFYSKSDGDRTQDEAFANLRRDWKIPDEPPFSFLELRGQYDDFQAWQYRTSAFAGVGYALSGENDTGRGAYPTIQNDALTLIGRVGAGASYEFGTVNELVPEALLAIEAGYEFADGAELTLINTLFPDLDDFGESRNTTEVAAKASIDRGRGLSLKAGAFNEYLSRTDGDTPHNSLTYFVRLVFDF